MKQNLLRYFINKTCIQVTIEHRLDFTLAFNYLYFDLMPVAAELVIIKTL